VKKTSVFGYLKNLNIIEVTGQSVPIWLVKRCISQEIVYAVGQERLLGTTVTLFIYLLHKCFYTLYIAHKDMLTCILYSRSC